MTPPLERRASSFRPDLQGLRAVAVLAVIADHLVGLPSGGFVGVDVFFVISGFLITGLLLREQETTGRISFVDFYRRRARRILPVALLVLAVTVIATSVIFSATRARDATADALWAAFSAANWRFISTGTDYSQADGLVSPVQHYWSLSVEEQFYLLWPVLMVGVILLTGRRRTRTVLAVAMSMLVVASFVWAMRETADAPTSAYFSTPSRAWEPGVGALLAVAAPALTRVPVALRPVLHWAGLAGVAVSLVVISGALPFPGPWAALPVASAALVIAAGIGGIPRFAWLLTNRLATSLGDLSYSLYLWHWPIVVLLPVFFSDPDATYFAVVVALTLALSLLSYHLVENPIRRSQLLERARRPPTTRRSGPAALVAGFVVASLVVVAGVVVVLPPGVAPVVRADDPLPLNADSSDPAVVLAGQIGAGLRASEFPAELSPPLDDLDTSKWFSEVAAPCCLDISTTPQSIACESGPTDTGRDVVILGDSFGIAWTPGIRAALEPLGWRVHPLTRGQCPASEVSVTQAGGEPFTRCGDTHEWRKERIAEIRPELTIIAQAYTTVDRLVSGAEGADAAAELAGGLRTTVDAIAPSTEAILVLSSPPGGTSPQDCITNVGSPRDCISFPDADWRRVTAAEAGALAGSAARYIDTVDWFCLDLECPGIVDGAAVRVDSAHLSIPYSEKLAPLIASAVGALGIP